MDTDTLPEDDERRKVLHLDVAVDLAVILDVKLDERRFGPPAGDALGHRREVPAGAAPGGTQDHDEIGQSQPLGQVRDGVGSGRKNTGHRRGILTRPPSPLG